VLKSLEKNKIITFNFKFALVGGAAIDECVKLFQGDN